MPTQKRPVAPVVRPAASMKPMVIPAVEHPAMTASRVAAQTVEARTVVPAAAVRQVVPAASTRPIAAEHPAATASRVAAQTVAKARTVIDARPLVPAAAPNRVVVQRPIVARPMPIRTGIKDRRPPMSFPGGGKPKGVDAVIPPHFPIHLTAQMLMVPGTSGQSPTLQTLRAPFGRWLVIEEVKFEVAMRVSDNLDVATASTNAQCVGSSIACALSRGSNHLTAGFIPVSMFGPVRKQSAERIQILEVGNAFSYIEEYSWRPTVPIIVAPNEVLVPSFEHRSFLNYKAQVRISYSGHLEQQQPDGYGTLPYVMAWTAPTFTLNGTEVEQISTEKDLSNPSKDSVLNADYMIGRIYVPFQTATIATIAEGTADSPGSAASVNVPLATDHALVRLSNSWGSQIAPNYAPFPAVFDLWSRKIDMKHIIPPDGYIIVGVKAGSAAINNTQTVAIFSVVGHREVSP